jgi:hypothetical protein
MTRSFLKLRRSPLIGFYVSCCLSTGVGGSSPLHHGFPGGPQSGTNHFRLESGFIRFSLCRPLFFVGSFQVQFALFSVRPWKDGLSFCPVEAAWLILQVRGHLRLVQNAIFFSWMRLLDAAVFNCRIFTLSLELASGRLPVPPFGRPFRRSDPWRTLFGDFPQMDEHLSWWCPTSRHLEQRLGVLPVLSHPLRYTMRILGLEE